MVPGTRSRFTVVHGAATQIALDGATTNLTSGATRTLTATIQDAAGNTVTSGADSTATVAFGYAASSGAGTVSGLGNDTAVNGGGVQDGDRCAGRVGHDRATSGTWSMVPGTDHVHGGAWCGDSDRAGWCDDEPDSGRPGR
jgi:hypothetical protein